MIIIQDSREQTPLQFRKCETIEGVEINKLEVGDYSIKGFEDKIALERKSCMDLFGTLGKGHVRFKKELLRAKTYSFFGILIEANYTDILTETFPNAFRSQMRGYVVLKQLHTIQMKYGYHIMFAKDSKEAAQIVKYTFDAWLRTNEKDDRELRKLLAKGMGK